MSNFWKQLPKGFFGLSPMDGITDHACRFIQKKYGKPAVMYTEFTCVEGITHGATRLLNDFLFDDTQHPLVAQIYGHTPKDFRTVATIVCELGFDGIDINMGCPAKNVTHTGSGAALIKTPKLAQEIIQAVQEGVQDWVNGKSVQDLDLTDDIKQEILSRKAQKSTRETLPVSIKTRIGYDSPVVQEWIPTLLEMEPAAIALHGRTLKQQYTGLANWEEIGKAAEIVHNTDTLIMGNGDVKTIKQAREKMQTYHLDGILLGRASWGNPWVFLDTQPDLVTRFAVATEHARFYEQNNKHSPKYAFLPMRKHLAWYISNFPGAAELRQKMMSTQSSTEVESLLADFLEENRL